MKKFLFGILFAFLFFPSAYGYSGDVSLSLTAEDNTLSVEETTLVHIALDTSDLLTSGNESVQTLSAYIAFPPDALEIIGAVNFSASSFTTVYVNDINNSEGFLEIVRARNTGEPILSTEIVGSFTVRVKGIPANGKINISPVAGQNSLLLNDTNNTDVLGKTSGATLTVSEGQQTPSPGGNNNNQQSAAAITKNASVRLLSQKAALAVGESATVEIRMDSGSSENTVSSTDLGFSFSPSLLSIQESSVNTLSGVFSSSTINSIDNAHGNIELVLFKNPPVWGLNALIGSFTVTRLTPGSADISLENFSSLFSDDVNNTNILNTSASSGITFTDSGLPGNADIAPANISETQNDTSSVSNQAESSSTSGGGGGGSKKSVSSPLSASLFHSNTDKSQSDKSYCEMPDDFSGKNQSNGKIHFSWNRVSDPRVQGFELLWGKNSKKLDGSLAIPKISSVHFPVKNLPSGGTYFFRLVSIGDDCKSALSDVFSLSSGSNEKQIIPNISSTSLQATFREKPVGFATTQKNQVAGKSFDSVPKTPAGGAFSFAIVLISGGIGLLFYAKRRGKEC